MFNVSMCDERCVQRTNATVVCLIDECGSALAGFFSFFEEKQDSLTF